MADQHAAISSPKHGKRVVIVDDDAEMRAVLRDALQRNGFLVREHSTGDGLLPLLEAWPPDAVVLDNVMEGATGLELLSCIRRRDSQTPVVFVTAFGGAETESEALRLGASYYMDKPFRVARLLDVLRGALDPTADGGGNAPPAPAAQNPVALRAKEASRAPGSEPADPRALARNIVNAARSAGGLLLFAGFEETLCADASDRRPGRLPLLVRGALVALAGTPCTRVVVVSSQDAFDLETQVSVPGVIYAGCRGLQVRGGGLNLCHPVAERLRRQLPAIAQELVERLTGVSGVDVELKELGLTVHARRREPAVLSVIAAHAEEIRRAAGEFRIWRSDASVDLFPDVDGRRRASGLWLAEKWAHEGARPAVVYLGDSDGDGDASEPPDVAYAIRVGVPNRPHGDSRWVADRAAAADLLAQIAFSWSGRASS